MLISYNWLQAYFKKKLPSPEKVADILTFSVFEIESVEKKGKDALIDVKVLPDRAHYALCHRGIARELGAAIGEKIVVTARENPKVSKTAPLSIKIENPADCRRYVGRRVEGVKAGKSPDWLRERLESIGQKSINNVVDAANFVMFDMGQPLHAFDADKVRGAVAVRRAKNGEQMETLDGNALELDSGVLIIADDKGPLAIAGVKGGKRAEVDASTKHLILESANFDPALVRRTSEKLGVRTDASKRFENEPSREIAQTAMEEFSALLAELIPDARFGEIVDEYPAPQKRTSITVSAAFLSERIGVKIKAKEAAEIFIRLNIGVSVFGDALTLEIPPERLDLVIPEDIADEVGRLYGYEKVKGILPPVSKKPPEINKQVYWEYKIRAWLIEQGFSEILTSSFSPKADVAVEKPLAADKSFVRKDITEQMRMALALNIANLPLIGLSQVKIFEIGKVFPITGEHTSLCVGIGQPKGFKQNGSVNNQIRLVGNALVEELGAPVSTACTIDDSGGIVLLKGKPIGEVNREDGIFEFNLDALIAALPTPLEWDVSIPKAKGTVFTPISQFPFIIRDIAFFAFSAAPHGELAECIKKAAGPLARLVRPFDRFEKDGKTSFAFRIVFQSDNRTLTDEETNKIMEKVSAALVSKFKAEVR